MPSLAELQRDFSGALLDPDRPVPAAVAASTGVVARRFDVYRNNVVVGLVEALSVTYPAVARLVGDEFFRGAAGVFVRRAPPRSPLLFDYGGGFADFLDGFEPARSVPYLGDVARLEWAWNEAYHAADAPTLDPAALAAIPPDRLAELCIKMHPATRLVPSRYPIVTLVAANRGPAMADAVRLPEGGEDALVCRRGIEVGLHLLPTGGMVFLAALAAGRPLGLAAEEATAAAVDFDLGATLTCLLHSGAATRLVIDAPLNGARGG